MRAIERDMSAVLFWLARQQLTDQTVSWSACRAHFRREMCQARFEVAWYNLVHGNLIQKLPFNGVCCPVFLTLNGKNWLELQLIEQSKSAGVQQEEILSELKENLSVVSKLPQSTLKFSVGVNVSKLGENGGIKNGR